ncbi:hypothetical protein A9Q84_03580 [Halobacteriovorax marinus]|uniref:Uncharacterized protein n=1 Tax=Halobacteriovorax marinus TaxID=97084 RepID=A0A1Y5FE97_9BACT|nr:hypothetical protein A9Q84_03580 [Halobacteriovorax marinus]
MSNSLELISQKCQDLGIKIFSIKEEPDSLVFGLDLWAKPGAKVEKLLLGPSGEIILYIKEKPIAGAANKGFTKKLAKKFGVPASNVEMIGGGKSKFKRFAIRLTFTNHKDINYYLEKMDKVFSK